LEAVALPATGRAGAEAIKASLVRVINGDTLSGAGRFRMDPVRADFARAYPGGEP